MASLQTNPVLVSPNAANAGIKASLSPAASSDDGDFAAMLRGDASNTAPKSAATPKMPGNKNTAAAPYAKGKHDAKTDTKTASKTDSKPERKAAAKTDDAAKDKTDKPVIAVQAQQATTPADADSDAPDDSTDASTQVAANQTAANQTGANQNGANPATAQATAQAPQAPPPQPDASAQAQQMLATAAPTASAQSAPANDNNNAASKIAGASAKSGRPQTPRAPADPDPSSAPAADASATPAKAAAGGTPDFLKAAGHQDGNVQTADAAKSDAPQPATSGDAPAPQAPLPAPAQPAPSAAAATNAAAITAPAAAANTNGVGTNTGVAANLHVAPQGPTPNVNSLAVEIAARSQSGSKEFQIRLDPPELGHVEVRLSIDASGKAEAHMSADHQQTLDLLQKNSPTLTSALRDAGLDVSQSGLNFSLKGQDRQSGDSNSGAQTRGSSTPLAAVKTIDAAGAANPYLSSAGDARLDIHV